MQRFSPYAVPVLVGALLATGIFSYDTTTATAVRYERLVPTREQLVATQYAAVDPADRLPDLIPLPGRDLTLSIGVDGHVHLLFSTTYINIGRGPVELRADPATAGVRSDIERDVYQRVYIEDGTYRDRVVGHFLWHQEHLHYHYGDFVTYKLTADGSTTTIPVALEKATFCLRDVSRVLSDVSQRSPAVYTVCGKERQGVSVGWGDTYYFNYPDQSLDMQTVPSGTYRLTITVNPLRRLEELAYANNESFVVFTYDKEKRAVTVVREFPEALPAVQHVHLDDPFGM